MKKLLYTSLLSLIYLALMPISGAQANYLLVKDVLSTSGGHLESSSYMLDYSTGQVAVGQSAGTDHIETGGFWGWAIWEVDSVGVDEEVPELVPGTYVLNQNYPNPFNPETHIDYTIQARKNVSLIIYNSLGQQVRVLVQAPQSPGTNTVTWDGCDDDGNLTPSGMYLYRITVSSTSDTKKMVMLK